MSYFLQVPGFVKLFFPKENVQTRFQSIYNIPIMTLDKKSAYIAKSEKQKKILFIHTNNFKENLQLINRAQKLREKGIQIYIIPQQNSKESFQQIKSKCPKALGKMVLNGQYQHPLIKYLKNSSDQLYDLYMLGSRPIIGIIGGFLRDQKDRVTYYNRISLGKFLDEMIEQKK